MSKGVKLIGALVFIILLNIGLFSFANITITSFWISWAFIHVAFIITVGILVLSVPEQKKLIFSYSESAITIYYFIIELVAGLVLMFQFAFLPVVSFIAQLIILAVFVVAFFATKSMNKNIDREENVRAVELHQFKFLLEEMKDVQREVEYTAPYKKLVEHAYDALAGSQIKSAPQASEAEQRILGFIRQLKQEITEGNEEAIAKACQNLEKAVAERNSILRLYQ